MELCYCLVFIHIGSQGCKKKGSIAIGCFPTPIERGLSPSNPEQLTKEDDIKPMIKLFTNNYKAVPDVQLKLAQLQESMGLAISLQQLFIEAAEKLHKEGKQASQDFNKTEFNL